MTKEAKAVSIALDRAEKAAGSGPVQVPQIAQNDADDLIDRIRSATAGSCSPKPAPIRG